MSYKIDKESNEDLAKVIQDLYVLVRKMNSIAGSHSLTKDRLTNQKEIVKSEVREMREALDENNLAEIALESVDLLITLSELVMILDGNEDLTKNPPKYLNSGCRNVAQLVADVEHSVEEENWIDALGSAEDLVSQINADMCFNIKSVGESMLSKFTPMTFLEQSSETEFSLCEQLQGDRYEEVYSEVVDYQGEEFVVFKTKYDKKNNESYSKGKFLKSPLTFKDPQIIIFD